MRWMLALLPAVASGYHLGRCAPRATLRSMAASTGGRASGGLSNRGINRGMLSGRRERITRSFAAGAGPTGLSTLNWKTRAPHEDTFVAALSKNGQVGVKVVSARNMLESMMQKRTMPPLPTEVLGRVMLCAMLVSHGIKDQETLQLTFNGDGLARGVMAISDGACNVRGWIGNSDIETIVDIQGKPFPDVQALVGKGTVQVVKSHPSWLTPYNGVTEIVSGEVAPDVAFYLANSEQRNTAIGVGVIMGDGTVSSAGGFYVEMMPGVEEESIAQVEQNLALLKERRGTLDPGRLLGGPEAMTPYRLVEALLEGLGVGVAEETVPAYKCTCTPEKVARAIRLLTAEDVEDILSKEGRVEAKCEFCGDVYQFTKSEVVAMREAAQA